MRRGNVCNAHQQYGADRGYRASYGDRDAYRLQFRDGFERGYQDGYGRSRYSTDGGGYFLASHDGGVSAFGDAALPAGVTHPRSVVGFSVTVTGKGYYLVTSGGKIHNYGDAPALGSPANAKNRGTVAAMAILG